MAGLENMLLQDAGRTSASDRSRRKISYSDNGSDSKDDDSDDGRGYSSRKPSGSQVPLRKRLDPERDDDRSSHEEGDEGDGYHERDSDDDSVGSDLYKDVDDRKKLAQMSELQREMIFADRASTNGLGKSEMAMISDFLSMHDLLFSGRSKFGE